MTWRDLVKQEMDKSRDPGPIIALSKSAPDYLDRSTDGYAYTPFTVWTDLRVYFPANTGLGTNFVVSAPRNPCEEDAEHVNGG